MLKDKPLDPGAFKEYQGSNPESFEYYGVGFEKAGGRGKGGHACTVSFSNRPHRPLFRTAPSLAKVDLGLQLSKEEYRRI